jgi:hypothetical protein
MQAQQGAEECEPLASAGPAAVRPVRPLSSFSVARPFYGIAEAHVPVAAAVAPAVTEAGVLRGGGSAGLASRSLASSTPARPGRVAGRAVLEPPGWQEAVVPCSTTALRGLAQVPATRLRIFSGTSNPVRGGGCAAGAVELALRS